MKPLRTVVLTASIENEQAIREWVASVHAAAMRVQDSIDELSNQLCEAPHISIRLDQSEPNGQ